MGGFAAQEGKGGDMPRAGGVGLENRQGAGPWVDGPEAGR